MLSRAQFEPACKAFARRHPEWLWVEGHHPGYGYLTRTTTHFANTSTEVLSDELEWEEDDAATGETSSPVVMVHEYIVYSVAFNVPAFYFTVHDTNGSVLSLAEIMRTSFFKYLPEGAEATSFALTAPSNSFPLLSQGEHPTLGTACWYLHPCESSRAVEEFMEEEREKLEGEERMGRWMEVWLMLVGSVVRL
ncbi:hypothetical protein D9613_005191 [Agrocybe pediades]|uniref:Ubiquitin-like-conjugating enzyme ATG10 n=1 Tax=Agrocybe pediades TaxID=84607 RepID=A0A8H4VT71_9AGAR|nr:hypothetical protein D9613_005191 [Agrocybe pediades]